MKNILQTQENEIRNIQQWKILKILKDVENK